MSKHHCTARHQPDAGCRQPTPLRGPGAVEMDAKRIDQIKDVSTPMTVSDHASTVGHEAMVGLWTREKQAHRLASVGVKYRGVFKSAYSGRSLRACVNAFCLDCIGLDPDEIRCCSASACPLWSVRPYRRNGVQ